MRRVEIRPPAIFSAQGLDDIVVAAFRVRFQIVYADEKPPRPRIDHRGTALVIYSRKANRVLNLQVGHPEWSSENRALVNTEPIMLFSMDMTTGRAVNWTVQNVAKEWRR